MTFEEIYTAHYSYVYNICFGIFRNVSEAEDATQDAFILVFKKLHQFKGSSKLTSWLYRVAYNSCLMRIRSAQGPMRNGGEQVPLEMMDIATAQHSRLRFHTIERVDLSRALAKLAPGYKTVLLQHSLKGMEHTEIARASGRSLGNSKSQLFKARMRMRKLMEGYGEVEQSERGA